MRIGTVDYGGQHNTAITYLLDNGTQIGDAVTATAAGTAGRGTADAALLGKVSTKEFDGLGAVVKRGVIVVPWVGAAVFGYQKIGVDGSGRAKVSATGRNCDVIGVDTGANLAAIDLG